MFLFFISLPDSTRYQNQRDRAAGGAPQRLLQHPVPAELLHPGHPLGHRGGLGGGRERRGVEDGAQDDGDGQVPGGPVLPAAPAPAAAGSGPAGPSEERLRPLLGNVLPKRSKNNL